MTTDDLTKRFEENRARLRAVAFRMLGSQARVLSFTLARGKIVAIDLTADPDRLSQLDVVVLRD